MPGADIRGNITSDWKHFAGGSYDGVKGDKSDALKIQYAGGSYDYDRYIPDLVTKLHIGTDLAYSGNIMRRVFDDMSYHYESEEQPVGNRLLLEMTLE